MHISLFDNTRLWAEADSDDLFNSTMARKIENWVGPAHY